MRGKSGYIGMAILCGSAVLAKYMIAMPHYMVRESANAAWIPMIVKCITASIAILAVVALYKPFVGKSFDEVAFIACGKIGNVLVRYIYAIGFIISGADIFRLLIEALHSVMGSTAPYEYFAVFVIAAVFVGAWHGVKSCVNLSTVIFPFIVLSLLMLTIVLIPHYRIDNIFPVMGKGADSIISCSFSKYYGFYELVLVLFLAADMVSFSDLKKTAFLSLIISSICSFILIGAYCLTIPFPASEKFFLPLYQMTRMIKAGTFMQRLEPLVVFIWASLIMCSMCVLFSFAARMMGKCSGTQKAFVPIVVFIAFFVAMLPNSETEAFDAYGKFLTFGGLLFPVIPVIITVIARIRRRNAA